MIFNRKYFFSTTLQTILSITLLIISYDRSLCYLIFLIQILCNSILDILLDCLLKSLLLQRRAMCYSRKIYSKHLTQFNFSIPIIYTPYARNGCRVKIQSDRGQSNLQLKIITKNLFTNVNSYSNYHNLYLTLSTIKLRVSAMIDEAQWEVQM